MGTESGRRTTSAERVRAHLDSAARARDRADEMARATQELVDRAQDARRFTAQARVRVAQLRSVSPGSSP